ncbi:MAG: hypothetical protein IPO15_22595 [Anaerolineae bacterium]|uniref:hypothetical protein n=1 Tax=Candidatus Amarolinea dominans TaxID=3140696 RepID=UPI0031374852|nr:hypothetical protein [Anaerolineae bacterium]
MADSTLQRMTGRTVGGVTYTLVYDAENRVQQVKQGSTLLASYTYDADGNRVKTVLGAARRCTWAGASTRRWRRQQHHDDGG